MIREAKVEVIGNYILSKEVGKGTFGVVRLAKHIPTGEKVAVKILEKGKVLDLADSERIHRELHIIRLMRHPSIIDLYEIIETPKFLFIIMEFATNGELYQYIRAKKTLKEDEASRIFAQILIGIEYIHSMGIVHRDLKPENLLLDHKNRVKIVDFGLSNIYRKNEKLLTACGSPCYAAPEMLSRKEYSGVNVDIWSCGVILYTLVCGCLPFEAESTSQVYDKILEGQFAKPDHLSADARNLIESILTIDPAKRIQINEIKSHPFFTKHNPDIRPRHGIIVGKDQIPVDIDVVKELTSSLGFSEKNAIKSIEANSHNIHSTSYKLILKKKLLQGNGSKFDINSENFDPSFLQKKKVKSTYSHSQNLNSNQKCLELLQNESKIENSNQSIDPFKRKVVISTGGTSSVDGKMGKLGGLLGNYKDQLKTKKGFKPLKTGSIVSEIYQRASKPRKDYNKIRKRQMSSRQRYEEQLPNLDSREHHSLVRPSNHDLSHERQPRKRGNYDSKNVQNNRKSKQHSSGLSDKFCNPNSKNSFLNQLVRRINNEKGSNYRKKKSSGLGSSILGSSRQDSSFHSKKRSSKKLNKSKEKRYISTNRRKKHSKTHNYSISNRRSSNSRRNKKNVGAFSGGQGKYSKHLSSFLIEDLIKLKKQQLIR